MQPRSLVQAGVEVGVHHLADAAFYVFAADIAPSHGSLRGADDFGEVLVFIAERLWDDECDVHIAAFPHTFGESVAGGA